MNDPLPGMPPKPDDVVSDDPTSPTDHHSIGEVLTLLQADFPDVSISKIRFLESRGLVTPHRAPSGYRKFVDADVERLRWILTMQRDQFLPLRVIKERLDEGSIDTSEPSESAAPIEPPRTPSSRFRTPTPGVDDLEPADLARLAGLSAPQLDSLVRFGIIEPHDTVNGSRYSRDELKVAKAASAFMRHGIEARHLKAWRVAAEREAGMLEQIIRPISRQGSTSAQNRAREAAEDLIDMGNAIREAIIVKSLRQGLGLTSD